MELLLTSRTKIVPSANLTWKPCFDDFTCSRLQVPLDYSNKSLGTTSIAFIKLAGENATAESPSIVLIPGKIPTTITPIQERRLTLFYRRPRRVWCRPPPCERDHSEANVWRAVQHRLL